QSGAGKTHLIRALRTQAHREGRAYFGYAQMSPDVDDYAVYFLRRLINALEKPYDPDRGGMSGLSRLTHTMVADSAALAPADLDELREATLDPMALARLVLKLADDIVASPRFHALNLDVNIVRALLYLQRADPRIDQRVRQYLQGQKLNAFSQETVAALDANEGEGRAFEIIEALGRLMWAVDGSALVFCIDQVEDLRFFADPTERFQKAVRDLIQIANCVPTSIIVISCLGDFYGQAREELAQSYIDRIEKAGPVLLSETRSADEARAIIAHRLAYGVNDAAKLTVEEAASLFAPDFYEDLRGLSARRLLEHAQKRCLEEGLIAPPPAVAAPEVALGPMPHALPVEPGQRPVIDPLTSAAPPVMASTSTPPPLRGADRHDDAARPASAAMPTASPAQVPMGEDGDGGAAAPSALNYRDMWERFDNDCEAEIPLDDQELMHVLSTALHLTRDEWPGALEMELFALDLAEDLPVFDLVVRHASGHFYESRVFLCNRPTQGGGLKRQLDKVLQHMSGRNCVMLRASDFPPNRKNQTASRFRTFRDGGGRAMVIPMTEWERMLKVREFHARHKLDPGFTGWFEETRLLSNLLSIVQILRLDLIGGRALEPAMPARAKPEVELAPPPTAAPPTAAVPAAVAAEPDAPVQDGADAKLPTPVEGSRGAPQGERAASVPTATTYADAGYDDRYARGASGGGRGGEHAGGGSPPLLPTSLPSAIPQEADGGANAPRRGLFSLSRLADWTGWGGGGLDMPSYQPPTAPRAVNPAIEGLPSAQAPKPAPGPTTAPTPAHEAPEAAGESVILPPAGDEVVPFDPHAIFAGREIDAGDGVSLPMSILKRHTAVLGGSGSGKTTLALSIIEQLLERGVPAILLDRKGDLCSYANPDVWRHDPSISEERRARLEALQETTEVAVFTPGRSSGRPISITLLPNGIGELPEHELQLLANLSSAALGEMLHLKNSATHQKQSGTLSVALKILGSRATGEVTLGDLICLLEDEDPELTDLTQRMDPSGKLRRDLVAQLDSLRHRNSALFEGGGETLSMESLLGRGPQNRGDKTRLSVIYTGFLGDNENILFWVAQFLSEALRFCQRNPNDELQAVVMFDEADLYIPANAKPATAEPLQSLLKRARSAGLGLMLATQSPGDLDYKSRDQITSWFIGRVREDTALRKLKAAFQSESGLDAAAVLPHQTVGEFHLVQEGRVRAIKAQRSLINAEQVPFDRIERLAGQTEHAAKSQLGLFE
ncbi:MAG: helicase HerA-like domain-containing protein, partial [Pseudomonadota bacterium]